PGVVRDEAARGYLLIFRVLVLDDLDPSMAGLNRGRDALAVVRLAAVWQVRSQAHGDLALDGSIDVIAPPDRDGTLIEVAVEDRAGAGMANAHQLLHHPGGNRDLVANHGPAGRRPARLQDFLRAIGLVEVLGLDLLRKRRQVAARAREGVEI